MEDYDFHIRQRSGNGIHLLSLPFNQLLCNTALLMLWFRSGKYNHLVVYCGGEREGYRNKYFPFPGPISVIHFCCSAATSFDVFCVVYTCYRESTASSGCIHISTYSQNGGWAHTHLVSLILQYTTSSYSSGPHHQLLHVRT